MRPQIEQQFWKIHLVLRCSRPLVIYYPKLLPCFTKEPYWVKAPAKDGCYCKSNCNYRNPFNSNCRLRWHALTVWFEWYWELQCPSFVLLREMYICGDTGKSFSLDQAGKTGFHSQPRHIMSLTEPLLQYGVKWLCCGGPRVVWCEIQFQLVKRITYCTEC